MTVSYVYRENLYEIHKITKYHSFFRFGPGLLDSIIELLIYINIHFFIKLKILPKKRGKRYREMGQA
jgi:hypothetical protein